jgi:acyl-CoA synthetase (AMP-forming)/AMP-acid ligase II
VVIFLINGFEFPGILLGLFRAGFLAVPVNVKLHAREVAFIVRNSCAKAVVVDAGVARTVEEALDGESADLFVAAFPLSPRARKTSLKAPGAATRSRVIQHGLVLRCIMASCR